MTMSDILALLDQLFCYACSNRILTHTHARARARTDK